MLGIILTAGWRNSSVGESTRFIPVVSGVQIPFPLLVSLDYSRLFLREGYKPCIYRKDVIFVLAQKYDSFSVNIGRQPAMIRCKAAKNDTAQ